MNKLVFDDYPVRTSYKVHWGDMDAANHVNNLVYLKWTESIRLEYFIAMGVDTTFRGGAAGPILAWQDCKYIFPVTYPDTVNIGMRTVEINDDRFTMESGIFSERHGRIVAVSRQIIVPYDFEALRKVEMPEAWLAGIERIRNSVI